MCAAGGCYDVDGLASRYPGGGDGGVPGDLAPSDGPPTWHPVATPGTDDLRGVWADSSDVFAIAANSRIVHVTAADELSAMDPAPPGFNLRAVGGATTPFAAGDSGALLSRAGGSWSAVSLGDATFYSLWAAGASDVWAAGSSGSVAHFGAAGWAYVTPPDVTFELHGVWSRAADLFVCGKAGALAHGTVAGDGSVGWVTVAAGTSTDLLGLWGNASDLFVVGAGGLILHSSDGGKSFAPEGSPTTVTLYAVAGTDANVWAVGDGGTILRRDRSAWQLDRTGGPALRAVWVNAADDAWAAGDTGTVLHLRR